MLSLEISRGRALLAGGASVADILVSLRQWRLKAPNRGTRKIVENLAYWNVCLCQALEECLSLGAPVGRLLREVQPMVRREERSWVKLQVTERQFAFQGAVAFILPWAVAGLTDGISLNTFAAAGLGFQCAGLGFFQYLIRRATRRPENEATWLFEFLVSAWMRVLAGMSLHPALRSALRATSDSMFSLAWRGWLTAYDGGCVSTRDYCWPAEMKASPEIARFVSALLRSGAPAADALADYLSQMDEERQAALEERIGALPPRISLLFCGFLAPAMFLILMGGLWPTLSTLSM